MEKKRVLFIDRDGTIIDEPKDTEQVDALDKLAFIPGAITGLNRLAGLNYDLVLATNQDGLGTPSFPLSDFKPAHEKMIATLQGENIIFADQLIDRSFPSEGRSTRKPGVGMFTKYFSDYYDLANSYVIGDRWTDVELARNLGAKAILLTSDVEQANRQYKERMPEFDALFIADSWKKIADYIITSPREIEVYRKTRETEVSVSVNLDKYADVAISTGLNFFDHMLAQIGQHAQINLSIQAKGDLQVDAHHTMEDVAIVLGQAIREALGDKRGIDRYGFVLPMDDSRAMVLLDFGGRISFDWDVEFTVPFLGDVPTEMFAHFFKSLAEAMQCNLFIACKGENNHHKIEAIFKAFAHALKNAIHRNPFNYELPSSKGVL